MPITYQWLGLFATVTVFSVMLALGLNLGREPFAALRPRRWMLARVLVAVLVAVPALAVVALHALGVKAPVAVGIVLMTISPGAPVALRRSLDAGGHPGFAPAMHLVIVTMAVLTVPAWVAILDWTLAVDYTVTPFDIARQVFFAQLLPLALGAALRALCPGLAARLVAPLARVGNWLLLAVALAVLADGPSVIATVGWTPVVAGLAITAGALVVGSAAVWADAGLRPAAAIAAAMRNPGLAIVIAAVNRLPDDVVATVLGYTLGLSVTLTAYLLWRRRS
jgi:bile acid:Na+ symporter, BASS family